MVKKNSQNSSETENRQMITKEDLITKFKKACYSPLGIASRKLSVETQFYRRRWDVNSPMFGKIAIVNDGNVSPYIICWVPICFSKFHPAGEFKYLLTYQEYKELRGIYKGDFKDDVAYLTRIGVIDFDD